MKEDADSESGSHDGESDSFHLVSDTSAPVLNGSTGRDWSRFEDTLNRVLPYRYRGRYLSYLITRIFLVLTSEGPGSLLRRGCTLLRKKLPFLPLNAKIPVLRISIDAYDAAIPLTLDVALEGRFVSPVNHLHAIEIETRVDSKYSTRLRLTLREGSSEGSIVREAEITRSMKELDDFSRWEFKPIPDSRERIYHFHIVSTGSVPAAVWNEPTTSHPNLQLFRGGKEIGGRIGIHCYTRQVINDPYQFWMMQNEPSHHELERMRLEGEHFPFMPKISLVLPAWDTNTELLHRAIDSVLMQVYDNWELCIAIGSAHDPRVRCALQEYGELDQRIRVQLLPENTGISGISNEALGLVTGMYIGFLDHDDELAPFALYEVVKLLNDNKNFKFIYSDQDSIGSGGERTNPYFKPDWSPDTFLSQNYICNFTVIRHDLIRRVGGFRPGYDGSQDYDLFLRVTEMLSEHEIGHIPKILYHGRNIQGSPAGSIEVKAETTGTAMMALKDAMARRNIAAVVTEGSFRNSYRVRYEIIGNPLVSIIIPTKDKVPVLKTCINSILGKTGYSKYEILIIDNQSHNPATFDYYRQIEADHRVRILKYDKPFNFSAMNNFAASHARGDHLVLLNNDTEVISGEWLSAMLEHSQRKGIGAVGAKLLYPDNTLQHAGIITGLGRIREIEGNPSVAGHAHRYLPPSLCGYYGRACSVANVGGVTAACLMMPKDIFNEIGGFDENLAVAFNDVDLCMKIRNKGYRIVYTPYAQLYHHEYVSRGYEDSPEKRARFYGEVRYIRKKWGAIIDRGDPFYSPNLTPDYEDYSIRV